MQEFPLHRTIVVIDVAGFTNPNRTLADHAVVQESLHVLVRQALTESEIDLSLCEIADRGDGMMILIDPKVPKNLLADRLLGRLIVGLKRYNSSRVESATFKVRIGFHSGEVLRNEYGAIGPAVNFTFRIVEAQEAKRVLRHSGDVLAVIASELFYREVIAADPGTNPDRYWQIPVDVKETSTTAWLSLPDSQQVQDLLTRTELDPMYKLLSSLTKVEVPQLLTLLSRAGGVATPQSAHCADAWEAFRYLSDFNADGDGFPPALEFVRLLAIHVDNPLRNNLLDWLTSQATNLQLIDVLRARRAQQSATVAARSRLHLLIMAQPYGIDRFLLTCWRQDDPDEWPPPRGESREVAFDDLEAAVDEFVIDAECAWSAHGGPAALEFLLPRSLLGLPVHRWHKEHDSQLPRPLFMDYPIAIRSWDRMHRTDLHRVWRARWLTMKNNPSLDRVHFCQRADLGKQNVIEAILSSPQWTLTVLTGPPSDDNVSSSGSDELTAALRAGIPAIIWHPRVSSDGLREIVTWLVEGDNMIDLPARTRSSRLAALQRGSPAFDVDLACDLVVLWDDPERTVVIDQPSVQPRP